MGSSNIWMLLMKFCTCLIQKKRKSLSLTQQGLPDAANLHINQTRHYETRAAQSTLEGLIKLAKALLVSLDELVFEASERDPSEKMRFLFMAIGQLNQDEQQVIQELLEGMVMKYQTRRGACARMGAK